MFDENKLIKKYMISCEFEYFIVFKPFEINCMHAFKQLFKARFTKYSLQITKDYQIETSLLKFS